MCLFVHRGEAAIIYCIYNDQMNIQNDIQIKCLDLFTYKLSLYH